MEMAGMSRLQALATAPGMVVFHLNFAVDEHGVPIMRGHIAAELTMACQRCLEDMAITIDRDIEVGFVFDDAHAAQASSRLEICTLKEDYVSLANLLEDELILALPVIAAHNDDKCARWQDDAGGPNEDDAGKENPFAVLRDLKPR